MEKRTIEIPEGAFEFSKELRTKLKPNIQHKIIPWGMTTIPDFGLPEGDYHVEIIGYVMPVPPIADVEPIEISIGDD